MRKIGRDLANAFDQLTAEFRRAQQSNREAAEVAALFQLHRQYRYRPAGTPPRKETAHRLSAAVQGYEVEYLDDLAGFGEFLACAAREELKSR